MAINTRKAQRKTRRNNAMTARKVGGKRKLSPALREWNKLVMEKYREMKKRNPSTKLMDAMRAAKKDKSRK